MVELHLAQLDYISYDFDLAEDAPSPPSAP
jgi:hypothetical protein